MVSFFKSKSGNKQEQRPRPPRTGMRGGYRHIKNTSASTTDSGTIVSVSTKWDSTVVVPSLPVPSLEPPLEETSINSNITTAIVPHTSPVAIEVVSSSNNNFTRNGVNGISDDYQTTEREGEGAVSISSSKKTNNTHRSRSPFAKRQGRDSSSTTRGRNRDPVLQNDVQLLPAIAVPKGQTVSRSQLEPPSPHHQTHALLEPPEEVHDTSSMRSSPHMIDGKNTSAIISGDVVGTITISKVSSASSNHYITFPTFYKKSRSTSLCASLGDESSLEERSSVRSSKSKVSTHALINDTIDSRDDTVEDVMSKSQSVSFADTYSSDSGEEEQSRRDDNDTIDFPTEQIMHQNHDDESVYDSSSFCSCGTIDQVEDVNVADYAACNDANNRDVEFVSEKDTMEDDDESTNGSDSSSTCSGTIDGATLDGTIDDGTVDDGTVGNGTVDDRTVLSYFSNQVDKERAKVDGGLGWFSWFVCFDGLENDVGNKSTSVPPTDRDDDATYDSLQSPNVSNNSASKMADEEKKSTKQITPIKFDQPPNVPLRRVPSLGKTLGFLKKSGSYDKSVASDSASTSSKKKLKCMFKSKEKSPKDKSPSITSVPPKNESTVDVYSKPLDSDNKLYRDLVCMNHDGIENLVVRECNHVPRLNARDHLLIKVEASTVSPRDCIDRGDRNTEHAPFIPGFQAVGQVCAVGASVKSFDFRVGDHVAVLLPNGGGNARYLSIPASIAILLPKRSLHDDLVCLVANYMTAYQCLKLSKKDGAPLTNANVLIIGGSGPVGQALIELAVHEGANVFTTAHKMHEEHLTNLGTKWYSIRPDKWLPDLEGRMDVVVDNLKIDGYESSFKALTRHGILICNVGNASELTSVANNDDGMSVWWSTMKTKYFCNRAIFYDLNESFNENPRMFAQELNYLACKLQRGEIRPKVAGRVTLNQVPKAQQLIEKGLPNGTVICLPWKNLDPNQKVRVVKI